MDSKVTNFATYLDTTDETHIVKLKCIQRKHNRREPCTHMSLPSVAFPETC